MIARPARDNVNAIDKIKLFRTHVQLIDLKRSVDQTTSKRVTDNTRLFVNLFQHEIGITALFGDINIPCDVRGFHIDRFPLRVEKVGPVHSQLRELPVVENDDVACRTDNRNSVRSQIAAIFCHPNNKRGVLSRGDDDARFAVIDDSKAVRTHDLRGCLADRIKKIAFVAVFNQVNDGFGVGARRERVPFVFKAVTQVGEILDDAIVNDGNVPVAGNMRVRIGLGRAAMRRPTRMPDAARPLKIEMRDGVFEGLHATTASDNLQAARLLHRDTSGIVTSIFKALQSINENGACIFNPGVADNAAHVRPLRTNRFMLGRLFIERGSQIKRALGQSLTSRKNAPHCTATKSALRRQTQDAK